MLKLADCQLFDLPGLDSPLLPLPPFPLYAGQGGQYTQEVIISISRAIIVPARTPTSKLSLDNILISLPMVWYVLSPLLLLLHHVLLLGAAVLVPH